jgi:hypothetical protein
MKLGRALYPENMQCCKLVNFPLAGLKSTLAGGRA